MTTAHTVADHLVDRLAELGADRVFGVPGDYSLAQLDHVTPHPTVRWVGCTNELNAGYAADGFARLRGIAALCTTLLCTTFGVGELSAINAVAGSYAEHVPVVHVVGAPALARQAEHRAVHHSLGDGEFGHFLTMHTAITCARAALRPDNAVAEIDRVLTEVRDKRLPGYLLVPADVAQVPVVPATRPLPLHTDTTDPAALEAFVDAARRLLERAGSVADVGVLAGLLGHRFGAAPQLQRLLATGVPHATTPWAKSLVDESAPAFAGTYSGATGSTADTRRTVEDAAALILAGVQFTGLRRRVGAARAPEPDPGRGPPRRRARAAGHAHPRAGPPLRRDRRRAWTRAGRPDQFGRAARRTRRPPVRRRPAARSPSPPWHSPVSRCRGVTVGRPDGGGIRDRYGTFTGPRAAS